MSRRGLWLLPVLFSLALPVRAAIVPATDLEVPYLEDPEAHAINSAGRIAISGWWGGGDYADVLLPPHPGGGVISLECTGGSDCWQELIEPVDIAPDGRVVGAHAIVAGGLLYGPATWSPTGALTELHEYGEISMWGERIAAEGINSSGVIVGTRAVLVSPDMVFYPARWEDWQASPETLPNDGPSQGPYPKAINDAGIIVGHTDGSVPYAAIWIADGGGYSLSSLPLLPSGSTARAVDINGAGQIVGTADDGTGFETAVLWEPLGGGAYAASALPRPAAGQDCEATAINDSGEAVGRCTDSGGAQRGIVWDAGASAVLHELAPLPGATAPELEVRDVNDDGIAVGWSRNASGGTSAVLWSYRTQLVPALPGFGVLLLAAALAATSALRACVRVPAAAKPPGC